MHTKAVDTMSAVVRRSVIGMKWIPGAGCRSSGILGTTGGARHEGKPSRRGPEHLPGNLARGAYKWIRERTTFALAGDGGLAAGRDGRYQTTSWIAPQARSSAGVRLNSLSTSAA
ncbi:MAG: hypothetical protein AMXMBFR80_26790 [Dehalococcoidia bacterium]